MCIQNFFKNKYFAQQFLNETNYIQTFATHVCTQYLKNRILEYIRPPPNGILTFVDPLVETFRQDYELV